VTQFPVLENTDSELMLRLADGDDLALNHLMDRWERRLTSFLLRMTGEHDTAVDLAQETFVRLYKARSRYSPSAKFSTYIFSIAANLARNHFRWKSRHPTVSLDAENSDGIPLVGEARDTTHTPAAAMEMSEKYREVFTALQSLPHDLKEALSLFVYDELSYTEIAKLAGCSVKAVETRIYRARHLLKETLQKN